MKRSLLSTKTCDPYRRHSWPHSWPEARTLIAVLHISVASVFGAARRPPTACCPACLRTWSWGPTARPAPLGLSPRAAAPPPDARGCPSPAPSASAPAAAPAAPASPAPGAPEGAAPAPAPAAAPAAGPGSGSGCAEQARDTAGSARRTARQPARRPCQGAQRPSVAHGPHLDVAAQVVHSVGQHKFPSVHRLAHGRQLEVQPHVPAARGTRVRGLLCCDTPGRAPRRARKSNTHARTG